MVKIADSKTIKDRLKILWIKIGNNYLSFTWFVVKLIFWALVLAGLVPYLAPIFIATFKVNNVTTNDFILFVTAAFIIAYTYETQKMKEQMIKQTELEQMPIMVLYVRNVEDQMKNSADFVEQQRIMPKYQDYLIRIRTEGSNSHYFLSLRNMGRGPAFNVEVSSELFDIIKYQERFFASLGDECPIAIIEKDNKKIESWNKFNGAEFKIYCKDITGQSYLFIHKIIDIKNKRVDFLKKE